MKLSELIQRLVELSADLNPHISLDDIYAGNADIDPEVRIAYQPSYPLAANLSALTHLSPDAEPQSEEEEEDWEDHPAEPTPDQPGVLWLAAGSNPYDAPYAPRAAWGE